MLRERGRYIPNPDFIRHLITHAGLTQQAAADLLHMPFSTFKRKLSGVSLFTYAEEYTLRQLVELRGAIYAEMTRKAHRGPPPTTARD